MSSVVESLPMTVPSLTSQFLCSLTLCTGEEKRPSEALCRQGSVRSQESQTLRRAHVSDVQGALQVGVVENIFIVKTCHWFHIHTSSLVEIECQRYLEKISAFRTFLPLVYWILCLHICEEGLPILFAAGCSESPVSCHTVKCQCLGAEVEAYYFIPFSVLVCTTLCHHCLYW